MTMERLEVTIRETRDGWRMVLDGRDQWYPAAVTAQKAAIAWAALQPVPNMMQITWEPTTTLGRQIVGVLT